MLLRILPIRKISNEDDENLKLPEDLCENSPGNFSCSVESTGYNGLLRLSDQFENFPSGPFNKVLMIGSISFHGLYSLIAWLNKRGNVDAEITLVDSSEFVIGLLEKMYELGYMGEKANIKFVCSDILEYNTAGDYDLIVTDILLPYVIGSSTKTSALSCEDYKQYRAIINKARSLLASGGCFLSRSFNYIEDPPVREIISPIRDVSDQDIDEASERLAQFLGKDLAEKNVRNQIADALDYPFMGPFVQSACGIAVYLLDVRYLLGPESVEIVDDMVHSLFQNTCRVDIRSENPPWIFHSYCCVKSE